MVMKEGQIDKHIWRIEANKKLNLSIIKSSLTLAALQVMQGGSSEGPLGLIRNIEITENKTTILLIGNKETANVFSKVLATNVSNVNIVEVSGKSEVY
jgi:hypothetical protein